jgi:multidrug efflux system outer membrane protein
MIKTSMSLACSVALAACSVVGPDYTPPVIDLAAQFVGGGSNTLRDSASVKWWERLNDPLLNELVGRGGAQNLDVRTALERIEAAEAGLGRTGLNAQTSGDVTLDARRQGLEGQAANTTTYQVDARYVLDLFGGFQRSQEQALANFDASQVNAGAVRLAYLSDITNSYLQARYFQEAGAITRQTISSRRQTLNLVMQRMDAGEATELEVQQARSLLASSEAALPILIANFEVNVFHIATLLAEPAGPLLARMQDGARQPRPTGFTSVGVPADLVRNRPDVQFAERNLAAATAAIGVAEAQLYPSVSLSGSVGTGTTDRWNFGPNVSLPVLNRGFLRANRNIAVATAREAELSWRKSVLVAVEEVQTAMTLCLNWYRQLQSLERATTASENVLQLSRDSYEAGAITLTEVLDAERLNSANKLSVADALRNYTISWMQVQVSTGQGWYATPMGTEAEVRRPAPRPDPLSLRPDPIPARLNR